MRQITINAKWHACWITKSAALRCSNVLRSSVPTVPETSSIWRLTIDYNTEHTVSNFSSVRGWYVLYPTVMNWRSWPKTSRYSTVHSTSFRLYEYVRVLPWNSDSRSYSYSYYAVIKTYPTTYSIDAGETFSFSGWWELQYSASQVYEQHVERMCSNRSASCGRSIFVIHNSKVAASTCAYGKLL